MHQPIQEFLEEYLRDPGDHCIPQDFHSHLAACDECAGEVRALTFQTRLLQSLRAPETASGFEPNAGFYAGVMARIEQERRPDSFWSLLLEPSFGRRLAYACAAMVLLMGTYLVSTEPGQQFGHEQFGNPAGLVSQDASGHSGNSEELVAPHQRDAVLVNLVSFHE